MDIKQLRALLAIVKTGSVTRAADVLHIVQPAISRQVKLLEEELGVPLFDRERHGMVLTPAGRRFADRAQRALTELDIGKAEISPQSQKIAGSVVVGLFPSAADFFVSSLMSKVRQSYPHVNVRCYISYLAELEKSLESGDVNVGLLYREEGRTPSFPCEPLLEESLYLVGPADAALDMNTPVPLAYLNEVPLILPTRPHIIRVLVERACDAAGVTLNIAAETSSMALQKGLVLKGVGLSILSGFVIADEVARRTLTACPIDTVNMKRTLLLAKCNDKAPAAATSAVLQELRETVRDFVAEGRWPGSILLD